MDKTPQPVGSILEGLAVAKAAKARLQQQPSDAAAALAGGDGNGAAKRPPPKVKPKTVTVKDDGAPLIQLPLWPESKRGTPNSFIRSALFSAVQGQHRVYLKEKTLFSQSGITVQFTGNQLNQEDLTLWETLVHLAKDQPLGNVCQFTAHGLLKSLGQNTGGDEHRRLHSGIVRLGACIVEITHEGKNYFGSLVVRGAKDKVTSHYAVELNRDLIRLYGEAQWTAIDWQQRLKLKRKPLAQFLHAFFSSHKIPLPVTFAHLQQLSGSRNTRPSGFKRLCLAALKLLVKVGFLDSYKDDGHKFTVTRSTPKLK